MSDTSPRSPMDWDQRFRDETTPWERAGLHPAVAYWEDRAIFQPGDRMIIPGCGRAPELLHFAQAGLKVTGADLSTTAIDWQAAAFEAAGQTANLIAGDVFEHTPGPGYDWLWEQTFLCAIPPALRETYESWTYESLKPGGGLLALFMQKEERGGPPYGCSLDAMRTLFPETRWIWPADDEFTAFPHPNLNDKPELAGLLRRR